MPLHQRTQPKAGAKRDRLMADLASELKKPGLLGQPIILEDRTPETKSIRVHVIWDRWEDCARELRWGVVVEAYEKVFGEETRQQITLALGVTVPEAVAIGLLPFGIEPARSKAGDPTQKEYRNAMTEAGASSVPGLDMPQLRFATREDAENTLERLQQTLPKSRWILAIHQDASNSISLDASASQI